MSMEAFFQLLNCSPLNCFCKIRQKDEIEEDRLIAFYSTECTSSDDDDQKEFGFIEASYI